MKDKTCAVTQTATSCLGGVPIDEVFIGAA